MDFPLFATESWFDWSKGVALGLFFGYCMASAVFCQLMKKQESDGDEG